MQRVAARFETLTELHWGHRARAGAAAESRVDAKGADVGAAAEGRDCPEKSAICTPLGEKSLSTSSASACALRATEATTGVPSA